MFTGSLVAIATPMQPGGALDLAAYRKLIDFHVANGTSAIVAVGTTGESPTVDFDEHCLLLKTAVEHAARRIPVIGGTGANSTAEAIELTEYAKKIGADACLSVVPYYNKPTQEGLYRHYRTIAEKVGMPMLLYNVPGRTVADLANDTVLRLARIPAIVGIKDATSDLVRHVDLIKRLPREREFALYSGNDDSGRRSSSCISPIAANAHLTGIGFASTNNFVCRPISRSLIARAVATSPLLAAAHISDIDCGATFAVTEITPCPPSSMYASAVSSLPE